PGPGRAGRIVLDGRHEDAVIALRVGVQERLLLGDRAGRQRRVLRSRRHAEALRGGADVAGEDLVPDAVGPVVDVAVPDDELLLAAVVPAAAGQSRVGDGPAA